LAGPTALVAVEFFPSPEGLPNLQNIQSIINYLYHIETERVGKKIPKFRRAVSICTCSNEFIIIFLKILSFFIFGFHFYNLFPISMEIDYGKPVQ
jgi:hypothetical protein